MNSSDIFNFIYSMYSFICYGITDEFCIFLNSLNNFIVSSLSLINIYTSFLNIPNFLTETYCNKKGMNIDIEFIKTVLTCVFFIISKSNKMQKISFTDYTPKISVTFNLSFTNTS